MWKSPEPLRLRADKPGWALLPPPWDLPAIAGTTWVVANRRRTGPLSTSEYHTRADVVRVPVSDLPPSQVGLAWVASRLIHDFAETVTA